MVASCHAILLAGFMSAAGYAPATRPSAEANCRTVPAAVFNFPEQAGLVGVWSSITSTRNSEIVVGLCSTQHSAYLVQFDDASRQFAAVIPVDTVIHDVGTYEVGQGKIHSQLWQLSDGWVYGGTHLSEDGDATQYPGGHWFRYDARSHKMEDLGLGMAHEGLIAMQADEPRGCLYAVTYPGAYLLRFDLASRRTQVLGKTSRDHQVTRTFFVLGPGNVYTNQVTSPASRPGGIHVFDALVESGQFELPPVYRKVDGEYSERVDEEGPRLYNQWLAGVTNPARTVAYTTGYLSGHLVSLHLSDRREVIVRDHGLTMAAVRADDSRSPYSQGMCYRDGCVLFTVTVDSPTHPGKGETRLLRYDPEQDGITVLGAIKTADGSAVTGCTAMACTPTGHLYLVGNVSDRDRIALIRVDLAGVAGAATMPSRE